ncbi:glycosyltransferase family 2 protein [Fulvivirga sp. M361]|uniref:glycosyltransferase family 2 protein n=1 Tax=Fulvivirga sp. M361 TaxID=2594266 RepID=UPI00117BD8BC|nr:glycosyltransferase family 2 protein [Fulvivirga sp. M361]TRX56064.1 glycosyltransferase family 2 protein [Fulvivirga sp. M361]
MTHTTDISVVVPLYNEEESLPELTTWISRVMQQHGFTYEIILVDDGSTDRSWEVIQVLSKENSHIKGISFNRNFGKSAALNTGFKKSQGNVVISMDADLQDSPDEIPELFKMITEGRLDMVSGWKKKRHDPISKTIPSKFFNFITSKISGIKLHDFNCGLKAYRSRVVKHIHVYGEMHRYIPVIAKWNGYDKIGEKVVEHRERKYGSTKFGLERFINGFLDLLSIMFVSRFKKKPMHFFGPLGTLSFLTGFVIAIWVIGDKLYRLRFDLPVRDVVDQPLFFLALVALIIGVQLFLTGFLAEMMAMKSNTENEYLVADQIGFE